MALDQYVSEKTVGKNAETIVKTMAGTKKIVPMTINAFETLPMDKLYLKIIYIFA